LGLNFLFKKFLKIIILGHLKWGWNLGEVLIFDFNYAKDLKSYSQLHPLEALSLDNLITFIENSRLSILSP